MTNAAENSFHWRLAKDEDVLGIISHGFGVWPICQFWGGNQGEEYVIACFLVIVMMRDFLLRCFGCRVVY